MTLARYSGGVVPSSRALIRQDGHVSHLIVLTENALTEHDVTRIIEWHDSDLDVNVLVPETSDQSRFDQVVDDIARVELDELRRDLAGADSDNVDESMAARKALQESLELLAAKGVKAVGALTPKDPVPATAATVTSETPTSSGCSPNLTWSATCCDAVGPTSFVTCFQCPSCMRLVAPTRSSVEQPLCRARDPQPESQHGSGRCDFE